MRVQKTGLILYGSMQSLIVNSGREIHNVIDSNAISVVANRDYLGLHWRKES